LKTFTLLFVFAVLALFAVFNWNAFMAPTKLWFVVSSIDAPIGLVMLGFTALLSSIFLFIIAYLQASHLSETKRFNKEIHAQRELAEQAEKSRIVELSEFLKGESSKAEQKTSQAQALIQNRLDKLDHDLRDSIEQSGNTLAAYIGELEDRLTKK
jgi:hypothetical protein